MKKEKLILPEIKLLGIKTRTNNKDESHQNTAKIGNIVQQYFYNHTATKIKNRKNPGTTFCVYSEYANDFMGDYTYFIGEEVSSTEINLDNLFQLIIPSQNYIKLTTDHGIIPDLVIKAWQKIWQMTETELGGKRNYKADFEIYDNKALDQNNAVVDIYIGVLG